jgi:DNA-binding MarR family transcriptional regulator
LIDKLEAQGLAQRCAGEDRRVKLIQLTEQGLAFVEETFAALQRVCAALMRPFSAAEQREFHRLLTRLLGNTR